ncbi:BTAD domain-containing putative transcriptional regulator [Longispora sp. NPDC051575]|uniref:AfsR/SARP family transcriptional regulator n=1 Tax=Longispora sp. NPDC051575 TaxID=3154943 RepID=UPI0034415B88
MSTLAQRSPFRTVHTSRIEIRCFGGFRLRVHGRPIDYSTIKPRTRTALRLLAMRAGHSVHRETLIDALWPGTDAVPATHNLHVTLSSLRKFLDTEAGGSCQLARSGDAYQLVLPTGGYSDVATFGAAIDTAHDARLAGDFDTLAVALRTALDVYHGELLPEDGPEEWVVGTREALRRRAATAAVDLARSAMLRDDHDEAVSAAEQCTEIDRYCDAGWRLLIDACTRLGDRAAAGRARQRYAEVVATLD